MLCSTVITSDPSFEHAQEDPFSNFEPAEEPAVSSQPSSHSPRHSDHHSKPAAAVNAPPPRPERPSAVPTAHVGVSSCSCSCVSMARGMLVVVGDDDMMSTHHHRCDCAAQQALSAVSHKPIPPPAVPPPVKRVGACCMYRYAAVIHSLTSRPELISHHSSLSPVLAVGERHLRFAGWSQRRVQSLVGIV